MFYRKCTFMRERRQVRVGVLYCSLGFSLLVRLLANHQ